MLKSICSTFKPLSRSTWAWMAAAALCLPLMASAEEPKAKTPQQEKMSACNKQAGEKDLKGDERKKFMSQCLASGKGGAKISQQEKMKNCNKEAKDKALKGDERKKFMSGCLKGPAKT